MGLESSNRVRIQYSSYNNNAGCPSFLIFVKVYASDVDFWEIEPSDLEQMEAEELYPPRFVIDVCGTQAHSTGQVWINFSGMENEFKSELILDANRGSKAHY